MYKDARRVIALKLSASLGILVLIKEIIFEWTKNKYIPATCSYYTEGSKQMNKIILVKSLFNAFYA